MNSRWFLYYVVPPVAIIVGSIAMLVLLSAIFKPSAEHKPPQLVVPSVEVFQAKPSRNEIFVTSQGTVMPRIETMLVAEVSGRVESVSPALYTGGFFKKGDTLVTIDATDYRANLAVARSRAAEVRVAFEQEQAASQQAQDDWKDMNLGSSPSDLVLRKPQLERAKTAVDAAVAAVELAERDLQHTEIKAPYDGLASEKYVEVGQVVNARASQIGRIYAIDTAEIRLPITLEDAGYLALPETFRDAKASGPKPKVVLEASYGGKTLHWDAVIDRAESVIDPRTRLLYVVAQVKDPYSAALGNDQTPLKMGLFVSARIYGPPLEVAYEIPRQALRRGDQLFLLDDEDRLKIIEPEIFKKNLDTIIVSGGLQEGDLICLSPLEYAIDGMQLKRDDALQASEPQPTAQK